MIINSFLRELNYFEQTNRKNRDLIIASLSDFLLYKSMSINGLIIDIVEIIESVSGRVNQVDSFRNGPF